MIIDANVASDFAAKHADAVPLYKEVMKGKIKIANGGRLSKELAKSALRDLLVEFVRSGRVLTFPKEAVDSAEEKIVGTGLCVSNDPHIIGLALVSGARLLYSKDQNLHTDFKSKALIDPPGSIYSSSDHAHLIARCPPCKTDN